MYSPIGLVFKFFEFGGQGVAWVTDLRWLIAGVGTTSTQKKNIYLFHASERICSFVRVTVDLPTYAYIYIHVYLYIMMCKALPPTLEKQIIFGGTSGIAYIA